MLFSWLKRRRRAQILAQPFSPEWLEDLKANVAHYRQLSQAEQAKLRDDLRIFISERDWEGCGGLPMTDEIKVTIAAQACLLILGLTIDFYRRVPTILVYPTGYRAPAKESMGGDAYLETESSRLGEAHYGGPVILSWDEVLDGGQHPGAGTNLVFHEFAHQLDMLDGSVDGTPPTDSRAQARRWHDVMSAEFRRLARDNEAGRETVLDPYGLTNEAEFFAVATECFFDAPGPLREEHPDLYTLLQEYYRQDPAAREVKG
jgi:Mlc titration factor MtfA (ptsG expression regulator)